VRRKQTRHLAGNAQIFIFKKRKEIKG